MAEQQIAPAQSRQDYTSDQGVRWCPGCGDYAVLAQVQKTFPTFGRKKEEFVFISGIGCSSRFPYYMNTFGFHTIHGRATAIASGVKLANSSLSVWVVTGDGDALSIGGNHTIHLIRRNMDINIMLFNNRIYGLTKGQYSPTSELGKITKSTPMGSLDRPFNPPALALGSHATFVARSVDRETKHLQDMISRCYNHKGATFLEIYQNCNIFNNGAYFQYTEKETKAQSVLWLEDKKPMVFGADQNKGIRMDGNIPQVIELGGKWNVDDVFVHDESDYLIASTLANFTSNENFPEPIGVFYNVTEPTYDEMLEDQINSAKEKLGEGDIKSLLNAGDTWIVD